MLDGRADVAVHSAKDLPASTARRPRARGGARARPTRATRSSARPSTRCRPAARVGTGSVRRRAQLAALRPDLTFAELRGNIPTRARAAPATSTPSWSPPPRSSASGSRDRAAECLEPSVMLPQVGQGALAVECRADDDRDARSASPRSTTPARTRRSTPSARSSPSSAAAATCPCGALADASTATRSSSTALLASRRRPRRAAGDRARHRSRSRSAPAVAAELLDATAARALLDDAGTRPRDRLPRRRRARRSRAAHGARRRAARARRRRGLRPPRVARRCSTSRPRAPS